MASSSLAGKAAWQLPTMLHHALEALQSFRSAAAAELGATAASKLHAAVEAHERLCSEARGAGDEQSRLLQIRSSIEQQVIPLAQSLAARLQQHWAQPQQRHVLLLELAAAAATRRCAYLRCGQLGSTGRKLCGCCRVARYCSRACFLADWQQPGGHFRTCPALLRLRQLEAEAVGEQAVQ
ncbi:hypothetical protein ABPG75_008520 [Micractinium tetrahymenae]